MGEITNHNKIDELLYAWIKQQAGRYTGSDSIITASQMKDPTQLIILKKRYGAETTEEAIDTLWMMLGSLLHKMVEDLEPEAIKAIKSKKMFKGMVQEKRYEYMVDGKYKVSGQPDVVYPAIKEHRDYKFTNVNAHTSDSRKSEWDYQLQTNGFLLRESGIPNDKGVIVAVYRDWHKSQFKLAQDKGSPYPYPEEQYEFPMWSHADQLVMIHDKVYDIVNNMDVPDQELPQCTDKEMWADPSYWTVLNPKGDRAMPGTGASYALSRARAEEYCEYETKDGKKVRRKNPISHNRIEFRQAVRKRCEEYCPVKQFCHQYKTYKGGKQ